MNSNVINSAAVYGQIAKKKENGTPIAGNLVINPICRLQTTQPTSGVAGAAAHKSLFTIIIITLISVIRSLKIILHDLINNVHSLSQVLLLKYSLFH